MSRYEVINSIDHKDVTVCVDRSSLLGDAVMKAFTFPAEFRMVQSEYPILLQKNKDESFEPIALFGFEDGQNLFLSEAGWQANYIPAMVAREPFLIHYAEAEGVGEISNRLVALDLDHPRVTQQVGEALFDAFGNRTSYLQSITGTLEKLYEGIEHSTRFIRALHEYKLIEGLTFDITLNDGSRNQLLGFYAIDEEKLSRLPSDALADLSKNGFLMPIFMMLASMSNIQSLIDRRNTLNAGTQIGLEELF